MPKPELQRIESTLNQLTVSSGETPVATSGASSSSSSRLQEQTTSQGCSFTVRSAAPTPRSATAPQRSQTIVQPFPAQTACPPMPTLPKFKLPSFSSHRHIENPGLATNLLKEAEIKALGWQTELQQILQQIQAIYLEGPIIDGWLESQASDAAKPELRHIEADRLLEYVQECQSSADDIAPQPLRERPIDSRTGYRLCGLDADGKLWSRPCPPEQLPHVSLAIARYQKLRQLLGRKQYLEARLSHLAAMLVELHHHLQEAP